MRHPRPARSRSHSWPYDLACGLLGVAILLSCVVSLSMGGWRDVPPIAVVAVPLIVLLARFPIIIDEGEAGIEVGFDSAVVMFLACTLDAPAALTLWSIGVVYTQVTNTKTLESKVFNVGVGIIAGGLATVVLHVIRGPQIFGGPRELVGVAAGVAVYVATDYVLSAISITLESGEPLRLKRSERRGIRGNHLTFGWLAAFDMMVYLGVIMLRAAPWWTLILLALPLAALLVATRAVTRGRENARRLQVLLEAAVDSQTLSESRQVIASLVNHAQRLLRVAQASVRPSPPTATEVGAQVRSGDDPLWVVAPSRQRARSTAAADAHALAALAAVSSAAFARLALTDDLVHLARYDPLTDLSNRAVFMDRLHYALHVARKSENHVALLFVDLDGFKPINDRFGHAAGDAVLINVARRLRSSVREDDTVARLGGDEFAVLFEDVELDDVTATCARILAAISGGVETAEQVVHVSASIGVAYDSGSLQADDMLRNADLAMYEAKAHGKNRFVIYEPGMLASRLDRLELVEALELAVNRGELTVDYQPVIKAETGAITGVEALARWRHGDVDVPPDTFITLAEETGLIGAVGAAILDRAARDFAAINEAAGGGITMGVNVSPSQLAEPGFSDIVCRAVEMMGRSNLVLEITEREDEGQDAAVLRTVQRIMDMGVVFAIDDFGVGFSSINYLHDVPARIVKVDAALSRHIDVDDQARSMLRSIMMMSQALGFDVVIEGVERESQLAMVRQDAAGAFAQGFLMHRPMPLPQLLAALHENRRGAGQPVSAAPAILT